MNDVSVVNLSADLPLGELAQPIELIDRLLTSGTLQTSGWGRLSEPEPIPNELRWIETNVVPWDECKQILPRIVADDTFCVYSKI